MLLPTGEIEIPEGRYRIVLAIDGSVRISTDVANVQLQPGTAAVLTADDPAATVAVEGMAAALTAVAGPAGTSGST
jgi:mannose-6-phosphate isomerase class I